MKRVQIEATIEAVAEGGEVTRRILLKVEGMVATRQTGLEITEHSVDPLERGVENAASVASCAAQVLDKLAFIKPLLFYVG